ncbi:hypothetical protein GCM10020229_23240 [Kitasatospora albolonga]
MTFSFERNVPVSRMVMISGFDLHSDFHVGLEQPVFVRAGESIDYERGDVVVTATVGGAASLLRGRQSLDLPDRGGVADSSSARVDRAPTRAYNVGTPSGGPQVFRAAVEVHLLAPTEEEALPCALAPTWPSRAAAATLAVGALPASAASPVPPVAAAVLTAGGAAGPAVAVGDVLAAPLVSGSKATFYSTAAGGTGVTCAVSQYTSKVTYPNPPPPPALRPPR